MTEAEKFKQLYVAANELMAELGAEGVIKLTTTDAFASSIMDALYDIDGGVFNPNIQFSIEAQERREQT